ncbi:MAG: hypothetical protein INR71_00770 [Terriglobus roseus]|nr:hypothetical protein [Terriglobus roseus]
MLMDVDSGFDSLPAGDAHCGPTMTWDATGSVPLDPLLGIMDAYPTGV